MSCSESPDREVRRISVVIAAFSDERWEQTQAAVDSVRRQSRAVAEIVLVIDHNRSLFERAAAAYSDVRVIENGQARGASGARNTGVLASKGDILAFLDDDAVADRNWLDVSLPHFAQPDVVGVGGRITPAWEVRRPSWFPEEMLWAVGATYKGMPSKACPVRNVWAGNMVVRRSAYLKADGFRVEFGKRGDKEDFQAEDTDFCLRVSRAWPAGKWMYEPMAVASHFVPARRSSWRFLVVRFYHEGRNKVLLARLLGPGSTQRESSYMTKTLPRGVIAGIREALHGEFAGILRAATIICCTLAAGWGVLIGMAHTARPHLKLRRAEGR